MGKKKKRRKRRVPRCKLLLRKRGRHLIPESEEEALGNAEFCLVCEEWVATKRLEAVQAGRLGTLEKEVGVLSERLAKAKEHHEEQVGELNEAVRLHRQAAMHTQAEMDKLKIQFKDTLGELGEAKGTVLNLREELREARNKQIAAENSSSSLWSKFAQSNHEREDIKNELKTTTKALADVKKSFKAAVEQVAATKNENDSLRAEIKSLEKAMTALRGQLDKANAQRKLEADIHAKELQELHSVGVRRMMYGTSSSYKPSLASAPSKDASLAYQIALSKVDRTISPYDPQVGVDNPDDIDDLY